MYFNEIFWHLWHQQIQHIRKKVRSVNAIALLKVDVEEMTDVEHSVEEVSYLLLFF